MSVKWKWSTLGDETVIEIGRTPSRSDKSMWDPSRTSGSVWLSIADLSACSGRHISDSKEYISAKGAKAGKLVKGGTLLMSFKLSIGKLAFAGVDLYTNEAIAALPIRDRNRLDPEFLYHYLSSVDWAGVATGSEKVKGATLNKAKLAVIPVPVPPLDEQQRIVSQIEEATAAVNGLRRGAQESHRLIGEVSRSQLSELLNRAGGDVETLDAVATVDYGDRVVRARDGGTKYPVYGGGGATFSIDRSNRRDCFIVSRFGMSEKCVRYVEGEFFLNDSGLSVATRDEATLRQAYLDRVLLSRQPEIYSLGTGTAQKNLDVTRFKQMTLTIPTPEVQDKLVAEYDAASEVCVAAEQVHAYRADKCIELTRSVLEAAFRGDL